MMAAAMDLSSDLVEEILSRIPATCLARLKYTCKQWETLIAEPRFVMKQLSKMRGHEQQFTVFSDVSSSKVPNSFDSTVSCAGIEFDDLNEPCLIMQAIKPLRFSMLSVWSMYHCDGLLLFVTSSRLLVLNPLLKQARWINGFRHQMDAYGLGYISSGHCDYRIVRFRCGASNKNSKIEIYEFESECWRVVVDESFDGFLELPESSVCLRGTPYWIGYVNGKYFSTIQSFDFSKERFKPLFLPPSSIGSSRFENSLALGIFRGDKLSLLHSSRLTGKIQLWVMKKHWSKLMTVSMSQFPMSPRYSSYYIANNGKLVLLIRDISSINAYIVGKDDDECQNVEFPDMIPSIGGFGCYYVPSLIQVPGFFRGEKKKVKEDF